jgi:hypothetical protein
MTCCQEKATIPAYTACTATTIPATHQQELVDFQVAIQVSQVCGAVQWCQAPRVTLIDLRALVKQVV